MVEEQSSLSKNERKVVKFGHLKLQKHAKFDKNAIYLFGIMINHKNALWKYMLGA